MKIPIKSYILVEMFSYNNTYLSFLQSTLMSLMKKKNFNKLEINSQFKHANRFTNILEAIKLTIF